MSLLGHVVGSGQDCRDIRGRRHGRLARWVFPVAVDEDCSGAFTLARSSPASSTVDLRFSHGDCDTMPSARVNASNKIVRITVWVKESEGPCDDMGITSYARVRLGAELGNRTLVGSCNVITNRLCSFDGQTKVPPHPPVLGP
jgi:hypothetical protein